MSHVGAMLLALCLGIFGCKRQTLDEDPAQWVRYAISVDGKTIAFRIPRGYRRERIPVRAEVTLDPQAKHTFLIDAQYDYRDEADIAEFEVLISLLRYVQPVNPHGIDMQAFEKAVNDARAAAVRDPSQLGTLQTSVVLRADGRKWLQFRSSGEVTSYMTPFSDTHALVVGVRYWKKLRKDAEWHRSRSELFERIAEGVQIIEREEESKPARQP